MAIKHLLVAAVAATTFLPVEICAQEFYKGKTIRLASGVSPGGGFDLITRTVGEFLSRNVPGNPTVIAENRPGAGGRVLANWLYSVAAKDGTNIGMIGPWTVLEPLWETQGAQFDASKFNWLINANREASSCAFWKGRGVENFADMRNKEVTIGSNVPTSTMTQDAVALNVMLGTKIKIVQGYKGTQDTILAAERGEVDGACGMWASSVTSAYAGAVKSGELKIAVQLGLEDHPDFEGIYNPVRAVTDPDDKLAMKLIFGQLDIARPFAMPPDVPEERVALMRKAFWETIHDKDFIAAAKQRGFVFRPTEGEKIQSLIAEMYATPKPVVERVKKILGY